MTNLEIQSSNVVNTMRDLVQWLVRQLDMVVRRKCMELLECKPEAAAGYTTKLIFVRMPRRIGTFHESSRLKAICDLRPCFNDALNAAIAKIKQFMLMVNYCNTYNHYDRLGNLSPHGKEDFWYEIDDLLERFIRNKMKLLPAPTFQTKKFFNGPGSSQKFWLC